MNKIYYYTCVHGFTPWADSLSMSDVTYINMQKKGSKTNYNLIPLLLK